MPRLDRYVEVQSNLFRGSGVNASTSEELIERYARAMDGPSGWGRFPPIHGTVHIVDENDVEEYLEAEEHGYEHELDWSRPLSLGDVGLEYVSIDDGHNRAWAAKAVDIPIRVKVWENPSQPNLHIEVAYSRAPWGLTRRLKVTRMKASGRKLAAQRGSLSWDVLQQIKNEYFGPDVTAIEVYPPAHEVVDEAPTRHLWEIPEDLAPSLRRR